MDTVVFAGRLAGRTNGSVSTLGLLGPEFQIIVPLSVALRSDRCLLPAICPLSAFQVTEPSPVANG